MRNYTWEKKPDIYAGDDKIRRFALGLSGSNPLVCFGINPSTATEQYADKTLHMVEQISRRNEYDGWLMLNIYPLRSTDPKGLPASFDARLHQENLRHISNLLQKHRLTLWAAWGTPILVRPYLLDCLRDICKIANDCHCSWVAFGKQNEQGVVLSTTVDNHPRHPSRLHLASMAKDYDVTHYFHV